MIVANAAQDPSIGGRTERNRSAEVHVLGNRLVIAALVTSPLMYLIELVAPLWVIYAFRASWVVLVAVAAIVVVQERRESRRARSTRSTGSDATHPTDHPDPRS